MSLLPQERAALAVERFRHSCSYDDLQYAVAAQIDEAAAVERRGLRATLQLSLMVLEEALTLPNLPDRLRVSARVCRGLCLDALTDEADKPAEASGPAPAPREKRTDEQN
jgi:hypothetical protein